MLSKVSSTTLASVLSMVGFGTLKVMKASLPNLVCEKNESYLVSSFLTTNASTSLPSQSHICSSQPRCEKA